MKLPVNTHIAIDQQLCGRPVDLREGFCRVELLTSTQMGADDAGLVHGGFVFGLADYAAMLAVNHPLVVLAHADVKFLKPVETGDTLVAEAHITEVADQPPHKKTVQVIVTCDVDAIFEGTFHCVIPKQHVLSDRLL